MADQSSPEFKRVSELLDSLVEPGVWNKEFVWGDKTDLSYNRLIEVGQAVGAVSQALDDQHTHTHPHTPAHTQAQTLSH